MTERVGQIEGVFRKVRAGSPMVSPADGCLTLAAGLGIVGDVNAHPLSPRQVLVTSSADLVAFGIAPGLLRENLVIRGLDSTNLAPGGRLDIGSTVRLRLMFYCEPCRRIASLVPSLSAIRNRRGGLAIVLAGGDVHVGDSVRVTPHAFKPLPAVAFERFRLFMALVPPGRVVTYSQVATGMGVAKSYIRALPGYLRRPAAHACPLHRLVDSRGHLLRFVPHQRERLVAEGVEVHLNLESGLSIPTDGVDLARYGWAPVSMVWP